MCEVVVQSAKIELNIANFSFRRSQSSIISAHRWVIQLKFTSTPIAACVLAREFRNFYYHFNILP